MAIKPPEIDISPWLVRNEAGGERSPAALQSAQSLVKNMKDIGLVAIKNHGYKDRKLNATFTKLDEIFKHPEEKKIRYKRALDKPIGYHPLGRQRLTQDKPADLIEGFNFNISMMEDEDWPEDLAPGIQQVVHDHNETSFNIAKSIFRAMAVGLGLQDEDFIFKTFSGYYTNANLRYIYYMPAAEPKKDQVRHGEHQDFSLINLLFVDGRKGLQIKLQDGSWVDVQTEANDLLLLCGKLMERWTADGIKAVAHRVVVPDDHEKLKPRRSIATFIDPNPDYKVTCMDGSNKYEPVSYTELALQLFQAVNMA